MGKRRGVSPCCWRSLFDNQNGNRSFCTYPNGVVNAYTYDALNRVDVATTKRSGGTLLYSVGYEYDLVGNRINIDETSLDADDITTGTRYLHYEYDNRYQLTREWWNADGGGAPDVGADLAYTYDLAGNRMALWRDGSLSTTYTYNARNEIESLTTGNFDTDYTYDVNGNRITKSVTGGIDTDYYYDTSNRLIAANVDGQPVFHATYDYRTRRVSKTEGGDVTIFRYDGGVSFDEWKDTGGNGVFVKQVEFTRGSGMGGGIGSILYSNRFTGPNPGREYFVYSPAVGHTVATLREDATVKSTNLYEAFGNVVKLNGTVWEQTNGPTSGASDNNRLANSKERDTSIGLDNHGMRYYDPEIGRYTTRDPIGYVDGPNVYLSVHNNPINFMDPLGLCDSLICPHDSDEDESSTLWDNLTDPLGWRLVGTRQITYNDVMDPLRDDQLTMGTHRSWFYDRPEGGTGQIDVNWDYYTDRDDEGQGGSNVWMDDIRLSARVGQTRLVGGAMLDEWIEAGVGVMAPNPASPVIQQGLHDWAGWSDFMPLEHLSGGDTRTIDFTLGAGVQLSQQQNEGFSWKVSAAGYLDMSGGYRDYGKVSASAGYTVRSSKGLKYGLSFEASAYAQKIGNKTMREIDPSTSGSRTSLMGHVGTDRWLFSFGADLTSNSPGRYGMAYLGMERNF